jgi:hypothetical protein
MTTTGIPSKKDRARIKRLYVVDRLFATEIARKLGLTYTVVKRVLRMQGIKSRGIYTSPPIGTEFSAGQLRVTKPAAPALGRNGRIEIRVWVRCRCNGPNSEFTAAAYKLRARSIKSCGCLWLASPNYRPHPDREWNRILRMYENNCRVFGLSLEQMKTICALPCFYCGLPPGNTLIGRSKKLSNGQVVLRYSGVDEVVHGGGHLIGNVLPACIICNRAKSDSSLEEWCRYLHTKKTRAIDGALHLGQKLMEINHVSP